MFKRHFILSAIFALICGLFWGCLPQSIAPHSSGTMTDSRDGVTYKTAIIGDQEWLSENLKFVTDSSWCFKEEEKRCSDFGRYYAWNAAMKACPEGWHLPSEMEVKRLYSSMGGTSSAGKKMKSTSGWNRNGNGTDEFGMGIVAAGYRHYDGSFQGDSVGAVLWTSTEKHDGESITWGAVSFLDEGDIHHDYKEDGHPVRCIRDPIN